MFWVKKFKLIYFSLGYLLVATADMRFAIW